MKKFSVSYSHVVVYETEVTAENEKEAKKKFKEVLPFEKVEEIWEVK